MLTDPTLLLPLSPADAATASAAQTETAPAKARPSSQPHEGLDVPGAVTPWEALQIVKAEFEARGPVFAEPLEAVLADLGEKPNADDQFFTTPSLPTLGHRRSRQRR